jgi:hypothetical protein
MMSPYDPASRDNGVQEGLAPIKRENAHPNESLRPRTVTALATGLLVTTLDPSSDEALPKTSLDEPQDRVRRGRHFRMSKDAS